MSKRFTAHIAVFSANLIYGVNFSIAKSIMPDYIKPYGLTLTRVFGAIILFWLFGLLFEKEKIEKKDFLRLMLSSVFGVAVNQMLFLAGLNYTSTIDASIILVVTPVFVLVAAAIFSLEKIVWQKILGISLGISGVLILILQNGKIDFRAENTLGNVMVMLNSMSYGIYFIIIKPLMSKYNPITVMKWVFLFSLMIVFPMGINQFATINWSSFPVSITFAIIFVVLCSTFLAYYFNIFGLKYVNPSTVSIYIYLQPVIAGIVAILFGNESLTVIKIISALLVFFGVFLVSRN